MKKILTTPIKDEDLEDLNVGDVVYLTGTLVTCRDVAHRRLIELGRELPVDLRGGAIFHAGPIVRKKDDGKFEMVSIGPTTSMRMEKFEKEFIKRDRREADRRQGRHGPGDGGRLPENKAVHAIFPGGCAVLAATKVEEIESAEWQDLGMPETLWVNRVREFGPLIISIDTKGNNLIEQNKAVFNAKKVPIVERDQQPRCGSSSRLTQSISDPRPNVSVARKQRSRSSGDDPATGRAHLQWIRMPRSEA